MDSMIVLGALAGQGYRATVKTSHTRQDIDGGRSREAVKGG